MFITSGSLHLIICTLFWVLQFDLLQNVQLVHSLHAQKTQRSGFFVIEDRPDEWYQESEEADAEDDETEEVPKFSFAGARDQFRLEAYGKAIVAGVRDNRPKSKKELLLGFSSNTNTNVNLDPSDNTPMKLVCYYNVPSMYDVPYAVFPEQIPPQLCTHIIIGFARVLNSTLVPNDDKDLEYYARVVKLKERNPALKIMLCVGGANHGSQGSKEFANMVKTPESRSRFTNQSISFLEAHHFDGLEIDWEFPAFEGPREQRDQLTALLTGLQTGFVLKSTINNSSKMLLSAAVPAIKLVIDLGYDIPGIAKAVDFVDLMCYDYHHFSRMTPLTGPNSPLYNDSSEMGFFATLNMAWSSKYWYQNGMPANKIVVGMPTYGHSYKLADSRYHGYYSVAQGFGSLGSNGFVPYVSVCTFMKNGTSLVLGKSTREPYAYRGREWISFDNESSAKEKADYVKTMKFGGMMFYSLNSDDAWKLCKSSKTQFPIIQAARDRLIKTD